MPLVDPDVDAPDREREEQPSSFVRIDDLIGRNLIVIPISLDKDVPGKDFGNGKPPKPYDRITADVIVLDGRKIADKNVTTFPHTVEGLWITAWNLVAELRRSVGTGDGVPVYLAQDGKMKKFEPMDPDDKKRLRVAEVYESYTSGAGQRQEPPF